MSRIETLIGAMTLAEKLGQLTMTASGYAVTGPIIAGDSTDAIKAGTIGNLLNMVGTAHVREMQRLAVEESRLGIPLLIGFDVVHGHRILFPVPLGEASLFDPETWALTARESAKEAAADGLAMTFAPMLDVSRDPRWGRSVEGPGEDPWLGARIAEAKVRGFQGANLAAADALAAVAKHYCAYGAVTAGRDYASVDISERTLREVHMPPFAAAVASGVAAVMPAFTDLAGIPMTANRELLRGWLRGRWGFKGVIVSDYNAIAELMRHGIGYQQLLAGLLLAGVRGIQPRPVGFKFHAVLVVNSAHLASLAMPDKERWLPLFWALDNFKGSQEANRQQGDWSMPAGNRSAAISASLARRTRSSISANMLSVGIDNERYSANSARRAPNVIRGSSQSAARAR